MTCQANDHNSIAGLNMDTWSGDEVNQNPNLICSINDQTEAKHCVKVKNVKTYDRDIYVEGMINSQNDHAKFDGPVSIISNEKKWEDTRKLHHTSGRDEFLFDKARITKKSNGNEIITTEIEYEDSWTNGLRLHADRRSNPLDFSVDLVS